MVGVHVEIMALEWVSVHACVNREEISVILHILSVKIDDHLVAGDVNRFEYNIFPVFEEFRATNIWCVIITAVRNFMMEKELQKS